MGDLLLVRHGETEWSRSGQHTSWTDLPLTAHGEEQAKSLAPLLTGRTYARALASPLSRALRTANWRAYPGSWPTPTCTSGTTAATRASPPPRSTAPGPTGTCGPTACRPARGAPGRVAGGDRRPRRPGAGPRRRGPRGGRRRCGPRRPRPLPARPHRPPAGPATRRGPAVQLATGTVSRLSTEHDRPVIAGGTSGRNPSPRVPPARPLGGPGAPPLRGRPAGVD